MKFHTLVLEGDRKRLNYLILLFKSIYVDNKILNFMVKKKTLFSSNCKNTAFFAINCYLYLL